jgi:uroporphyrinogen-III synthase
LGVIRVLVTRPEPGATRTAQRLQSLGYEAITLPLSKTVGLNPKLFESQFDAVIATSAQAFLHLPTRLAAQASGTPTFVVGKATAAAARDAGFQRVSVAGNDVDGLLSTLKDALHTDTRIVYLCGKIRRPDLEHALGAQRVYLDIVEVYDTELVSYSTDKLERLSAIPFNVVLVTSVTNADALVQLFASPKMKQASDKSLFICLSQRIAVRLERANLSRIMVCSAPDEDAMMAMVQLHFPQRRL